MDRISNRRHQSVKSSAKGRNSVHAGNGIRSFATISWHWRVWVSKVIVSRGVKALTAEGEHPLGGKPVAA
jgi:hypothetical protein